MLVIIYPFVQLGPEHQLYPSLKDSLRAFAKIVVVSRIFSTSSVRQSYFQRSLLQRSGGRALGCQIKQGMIQICLVRKGYHSFPAIIEFSTHVLLQMLFYAYLYCHHIDFLSSYRLFYSIFPMCMCYILRPTRQQTNKNYKI